jgi:hypothetical protein
MIRAFKILFGIKERFLTAAECKELARRSNIEAIRKHKERVEETYISIHQTIDYGAKHGKRVVVWYAPTWPETQDAILDDFVDRLRDKGFKAEKTGDQKNPSIRIALL